MEIISRKQAKELGLKYYFTGKPCKRGHVSKRTTSDHSCVDCKISYREENKDELRKKSKEYRDKNKDSISKRGKSYYQQNKEKIKAKSKKHREDNLEKYSKYRKLYYKANLDESRKKSREYYYENKEAILKKRSENKEEIALKMKIYRVENKESLAEWGRCYRERNKDKIALMKAEKYRENPMPTFIRNCLNRILTNWGGGRESAESLCGYSDYDLRVHIESKFKDGMSWNNRSEWHIDHIKPIKAFLDEGITDPKIINALSNLQPLWAHENLSKGAKFEQ